MTPPLPARIDYAGAARNGLLRAESSTNPADIDFEFRRTQIYATLAVADAIWALTDMVGELR